MTETKPPTAKVVPLHNGLAHLATMRRWVAWREETRTRVNGTEFTTKIPYDPRSNRLARIPTDPSTYGTRAQAERRWCQLDDGRRGGVGISTTISSWASIWTAASTHRPT